jgi:hypothetical protein
MADSANALSGMSDSQEPMETPQGTGAPGSAPPVMPSPIDALAGDVAGNAKALSNANPTPQKPGGWARAILGGVQNALAGIHNSPGGLFYESSEGARQQQAIQRQQKQQAFENQQKQQTMSREEAIARATIAHESIQTLYTGQLMSQLSNENQQKLVDMGLDAAATLAASGAPVIQENLTEGDAQRLVQQKKLDPSYQHAYPTGRIPDPTGAKDPSGNPRMITTWTVFGNSNKQIELNGKGASALDFPEKSTMSSGLYNTLYTRSMSAAAGRLHMQQLADEAEAGRIQASRNIEVQKAEPDWGVSLGKAYGNLLDAQKDFVARFPDKAGLVPEFAGGVDKWTQLVDQQQRDLQGTATLPKNEEEAAAQTVARKQAYEAHPTPSNKALYDRAVDMQANIQQVVQRERQFTSDLQRTNNEALKGVQQGNELAKKGFDDINKAWTDPHTGFSGALMQARNTLNAIQAGADGNGLLTSMAPTMEVLGINHAAGISRISPQEAAAANLPGGWAERWNAWATKAATGKLSPQLANEGKQLMTQIITSKHQQSVQDTRMLAANSKIDPAQITVMDINGQPDTLAHQIRVGVMQNPPKTPIPPGKTRVLASDNTFHDVPNVDAAKKIDPNLTVIGVGK